MAVDLGRFDRLVADGAVDRHGRCSRADHRITEGELGLLCDLAVDVRLW